MKRRKDDTVEASCLFFQILRLQRMNCVPPEIVGLNGQILVLVRSHVVLDFKGERGLVWPQIALEMTLKLINVL